MRKKEQFPNVSTEEIEGFIDERELPINATEEQLKNEVLERTIETKSSFGLSEKDEDAIRQKRKEIEKAHSVDATIQKALKQRPDGDELFGHTLITKEKIKKPWLNRTFATIGFTALASLFGSKESKGAIVNDSTTKKQLIEKVAARSTEDTTKGKIGIYTTSKTQEGGITPTGRSNSFYENSDNLSQEDLTKIAKQYNFRTDEAGFQSDLVDYLALHYPEVIAEVNKEFGRTTYGEKLEKEGTLSAKEIDIEQHKDADKGGGIGGRTRYMIKRLTELTFPTPTPEQQRFQPTGRYVINVRGDEKGQSGIYYFFDTEKEFINATNRIGGYSSREIKDGAGQASYNMNWDTFNENYIKKNTTLLGQGYLRDEQDQKFFFKFNPEKTIAHYSEGFAENKK